MQKYKPKTPLANVSDRVLRVMITCGLGIGWFVYLWGMRLTALTAGVAFGGLLWLCARQFGKKSMMRREKQMRRIIGGELALLTGQRFYPIPAAVCLMLFAACKLRSLLAAQHG